MQKNVWNIFCPVGSAISSLKSKLAAASTPVDKAKCYLFDLSWGFSFLFYNSMKCFM